MLSKLSPAKHLGLPREGGGGWYHDGRSRRTCGYSLGRDQNPEVKMYLSRASSDPNVSQQLKPAVASFSFKSGCQDKQFERVQVLWVLVVMPMAMTMNLPFFGFKSAVPFFGLKSAVAFFEGPSTPSCFSACSAKPW